MNKTFLLELTEKEFQMLESAIELQRVSLSSDHYLLPTEKEKSVSINDTIKDKLEQASLPPEPVLITSKDLFFLVDMAVKEYKLLNSNLHLSHKRVEESDFKHISLANAVILWLNSKRLLKKLVKFDISDNSCEFEETEE